MERRTKEVPCPTCGRVWTITKAGAEDFALMAVLSVPDWFRDKTGEERFKARQVRANMPDEAMWERAIENQSNVAAALDIMCRCVVDEFARAEVDVCCVASIPLEIVNYTAEEAGLTARFPSEGGSGEPGPASTKVRNEPARNDGTQGE